jgi:hypothetical protein
VKTSQSALSPAIGGAFYIRGWAGKATRSGHHPQLDFLFRDASPPHGLGHLADDAEIIARTIKSHEDCRVEVSVAAVGGSGAAGPRPARNHSTRTICAGAHCSRSPRW